MAVAEVDLEMDDLFGDGQDVDELMDQPSERRELDDEAVEAPEPGDGQTQEGDMDVLNRLRDLSKGTAKKRVMNPQPKLDSTRLQSARGLPALEKTFKDVKFKGKGHEKEDLLKMMGTFEHWAHRLFPKSSFDDFIEKLEKLGSKKAVQTTVKRIRMDMPILNDDFIGNEPEDATAEQGNQSDQEPDPPELDAEEAYEEMIRQEREEQERVRATQDGAEETRSPVRQQGQSNDPETPAAANTSTIRTGASSLSEEQQERIERNKRLAMEKRMKKIGVTPGKTPVAQSSSSSMPTTPSVGAPRPDDAELADELLRDLNGSNTPEDTNEQLNLNMSEDESGADGSQKENKSDGEKDTNDLELRLTESVTENEENTDALNLHISETDNSAKKTSSFESENTNMKDSEEAIVNGTEEDESVLSEKSDKGNELRLKLSVSDSDAMDVDD